MDKLKMHTPDLAEENYKKLAALFPDAVTETIDENGNVVRAIDKDVLMQEINAQVVDDGQERYQFTWPDKRKSVVLANTPIAKTLRFEKEKSVGRDGTPGGTDSENIYIEGDNLDALKLLQETYLGKVKMIYIDPPYNTGSDFVYKDSFQMPSFEYENNSGQNDEDGNQLVQNLESNGRFHTDWLNMMYPRLRIAKDLLSDDGAILITIDHNEHATIQMICDEIFGHSCFIGELIWRSSDNSNNNALTFSEDHNYILVYSKKPDWKPNFINDPEKRKHFKNPDNDPKGPWFDGNPVNNPGLRVNLQFDITTPSGKIIHHPANGWRWSRETMAEKFKTGELRFSEDGTRVIRRTYLKDMKGLPPSTLLTELNVTGHTRGAKYELKKLFPEEPVTSLFSTPKPTLLLKYLLTIAATSNCIVMDFFSGSSSMADATIQYNSQNSTKIKYIMVQIQEECVTDKAGNVPTFSDICAMGEERIRRAGKKIKEETGADIDYGFRCFKVDSSNMKDVYYRPVDIGQMNLDQFTDNIKEDRTPDDLLIQVMLDLGVLLSSKVEETEIAGKKVFSVADGYLIACFDKNVTEDVVTAIAKQKPFYAVFRDSSMANDSVAANFEQIFATYSPQTVRKVL